MKKYVYKIIKKFLSKLIKSSQIFINDAEYIEKVPLREYVCEATLKSGKKLKFSLVDSYEKGAYFAHSLNVIKVANITLIDTDSVTYYSYDRISLNFKEPNLDADSLKKEAVKQLNILEHEINDISMLRSTQKTLLKVLNAKYAKRFFIKEDTVFLKPEFLTKHNKKG